LLQVADVAKEYPTPRGSLRVLSDVSFSLAPGEAAAIMGPSGSGKSSLLYVLGALEPPSSGAVTLDGCNPFELAPADLARFRNTAIGFVFQDHCLLPQCTVLENVLVPTLVFQRARSGGPDAAVERARTLVDAVGLTDRIDHRPGELSGGERQRVAIARSVINNPALILADEPTGNLDSVNATAILDLLFDLKWARGATLVMVTHEPSYAERCARQVRIKDGNVYDQRLARAVGEAI
jgi:lipoprotein-releasing system ATP-binding protein